MGLSGIFFLKAAFFPNRFNFYTKALTATALVICAYIAIAPSIEFSKYLSIYQFHVLCSLIGYIWLLSIAIRKKMDGSILVLFGVIAGILGAAFDIILVANLRAFNFFITPITNSIFLLSQSQLVASRSAAAFRRAEVYAKEVEEKNKEITFFNQNLEKLVDQKTREIRSLLDNIPQGVLSVGIDGYMSKDYSAHLSTLMDVKDIEKHTFKSLVLDQSELDANTIDQIWQTLLISVGSNELNFEANRSNLVDEIPYKINGEQKILKATWSDEVETDTVVKILVTLLDVTQEKLLEIEAEKHKQELKLIEELIEIPPEKASQFFLSSKHLL